MSHAIESNHIHPDGKTITYFISHYINLQKTVYLPYFYYPHHHLRLLSRDGNVE